MIALELHPLCTLFPRITGIDFEYLRADIAANGLRQPIVVHEGLILDGGNRYRACIEAGVEPITVEFTGGNLVSFVLSANLHRRHLSPGQAAAIVASATDWQTSQPQGRPEQTAPGSSLNLSTVADRAAASGASVATQRRADAVTKADPELSRQVASGEITLAAAVKVAAPQLSQRPAPEPASSPTLVPEFDDTPVEDDTPDFVEKLREADEEIAVLTAQVEALSKKIELLMQDDMCAAIADWSYRYDQLKSHLETRNGEFYKVDADRIKYSGLLKKLRKAANVETNGDLLAQIMPRVEVQHG